MIRLGEGLFRGNRLLDSAMARAESSIKKFCRDMEHYQVDRVIAAATSATREAKNGKGFMKRLSDNLGIEFQIISGLKEAELILKGMRAFEPLAHENFAFLDIGGGSTEVGVCQNGEAVYLDSFQIGAVRLSQKFSQLPLRFDEHEEMRRMIRIELQKKCGFKDWPKVEFLFGASGTVKALVKIMKIRNYGKKVDRKSLKELIAEMSYQGLEGIRQIQGMEEKRADIILHGSILLEELMDFFNAKKVFRSKFALREGLLQEELEGLGFAETHNQIYFDDEF